MPAKSCLVFGSISSHVARSHAAARLSITLVETRQRAKLGDKPKRLTVTIAARPSRKLAAALVAVGVNQARRARQLWSAGACSRF